MKRIPEPELMVDPEQTAAYAGADFAAGHQAIVDALALQFPDLAQQNLGLDLGCGPLDVTLRILERFPKMTIHGVDGSGPMLDLARAELERHSLQERVILFEQCVPELELPETGYPLIFSSSFLHHLHDPNALWQVINRFGEPGTRVFIADLFRPQSREQAMALVEQFTPDEPEILKLDFFHSLLAAFSPDEIMTQLEEHGLNQVLKVETLTERHMLISGIL